MKKSPRRNSNPAAVRPAPSLLSRKRHEAKTASAVDLRIRTSATAEARDLTFQRDCPAPQDLADARFARDVERVCGLGPRAVFEMLCEIGRARLCRTLIEQRVEYYSRLDPHVLRSLGAHQLPPAPLHEVKR